MPLIKWQSEEIQLEISGTKIVKSDKGEYVIYQVKVVDGENSWVVQHRFRTFENLRVILSDAFEEEDIPPFPSPGLFDKKFDNEVIATRSKKLQHFLLQIIKKKKLRDSPHFRRFLTPSSYMASAEHTNDNNNNNNNNNNNENNGDNNNATTNPTNISINLPGETKLGEHLENGVFDEYLLGEGKEIAFSPSKTRKLTENEERFRRDYKNLSHEIEKAIIESLRATSKKEVEGVRHNLALLQLHLQSLSSTYPFILLYPKVVKKVKNLEREVENALSNLHSRSQLDEIEERLKHYEDVLCVLIERVACVQSSEKALHLHKQFDALFKKLANASSFIHSSTIQSESQSLLLSRLSDLQESASTLHFKLTKKFAMTTKSSEMATRKIVKNAQIAHNNLEEQMFDL